MNTQNNIAKFSDFYETSSGNRELVFDDTNIIHNTELNEAAQRTEDIKRGLIGYINEVINTAQGAPVSIRVGSRYIQNVSAARASNKPSVSGVEPYVDIELIHSNGSITNLAIRQFTGKQFDYRSVPALKSGMATLEKLLPNIRREFLGSLLNHYVNTMNILHGQPVKQAYGKISQELLELILLGDRKIGGRADYILAVKRAPFRWKTMRIPDIKVEPSKVGIGVVVVIYDSKLYSSAEVISNNSLYLTVSGSDNRSLYLFNDKLDSFNNPVILGPKFGKKKSIEGEGKYGGKIVAVMNPRIKQGFAFEIKKSDMKLFSVELMNPANYLKPRLPKQLAQKPQTSGEDDFENDNLFKSSSSRRGRDVFGHSDRDKTGELGYDPDEFSRKEDIIDKIVDKFDHGFKFLHDVDVKREVPGFEKTLRMDLERRDMQDLKMLFSMTPHRLANTIKSQHTELLRIIANAVSKSEA